MAQTTELTTTTGGALATTEQPASVLQVISRAASDPTCDPAKMRELLAFQKDFMAIEAEIAYNQAMAQLQPLLPEIPKTGIIPKTGGGIPYATYENIAGAVKPLLKEFGFTTSYDCTMAGSVLTVTCTISHVKGHSKSSSVFVPLKDAGPGRSDIQAHGSAVTYGKRYALCQILDIVTVGADDDGTGAAYQPLLPDQAAMIHKLLNETGSSVQRFLSFMKVGTVEEILQKDFVRAVDTIERKRK